MAIHSIYGAAAPAGTTTSHTDGTPNITLAQTFYKYGDAPATAYCLGGRVYIPAGARPSASVKIMGWTHANGVRETNTTLATTPTQEKVVTIPDDGLAQWVEVLWDTPFQMPDYGLRVMIGYQFVETPSAYLFGAGQASAGPTFASDGAKYAWSEGEDLSTTWGPVHQSYYRIGTGPTNGPATGGVGYNIDIIISDEAPAGNAPPVARAGVDQSVAPNTLVTLDGSASTDADGTIASYSWAQTSGPTVTLSGSGATRTFTPTTVGTYVFALTVTDDLGLAGSADSMIVAVATPGSALTIAQENALTGRDKNFWFNGVGSTQMPAFARSTYYAPGQTAELSVNYNSAFTFEVYRLGHYGDLGGRRLYGPVAGTPVAQPAATVIPNSNGAVDCAAWTRNVSWPIPMDSVPGWYYVFLKGTNGTDFGSALFSVSDAAAKKPILAVSSDATWHAAYNGYGGNNVYGANTSIGTASARALCSSYDKPVITRDNVPQTDFFNAQFAAFKFMESVGIEVGYATTEQINADPTIMDGREVILFAGHNEYVPQAMVTKTKALLASGQKIVNWAANDFFWRIRFGTTDDTATTTTGRVMWCRKDTMAGPGAHVAGAAFVSQAEWQGTWQDTRWSLREPSADFLGDRFIANGIRTDQVRVPVAMKDLPLWRNCPGIQALTTGDFAFGAASLGMEWDMPDGALTMAKVSSSIVTLTGSASDTNGETYNNNGTYEHAIALVQSGSGLVFNFNSDQWGATLDNFHLNRIGAISTVDARQSALNVFADFGVTANSGMVASAGLTLPTPVADVRVAYGLVAPGGNLYYSDGLTWTRIV